MGLEKRVLENVRKVMNTTDATNWYAEFKYGTLFVECTAKQAAKIETMLIKTIGSGVIVSKAGEEFAFDLV
jgi:hypothetical protein